MRRRSRRGSIPVGAPQGTVWYGGPIDRCKVTLRVIGDDLLPEEVTQLLGCSPTQCETKGMPVLGDDGRLLRTAKSGAWRFIITSEEAGTADVEEVVLHLLGRLPSDRAVWQSLGDRFDIDLFCGLFMESNNRGFSLSPSVCRELAERGIEIGFDIYCPHGWPRGATRRQPRG